ALGSTEATVATLRSLKALGVRLAIDDFGVGYSAFSYLRRFPVDSLKLDRDFINGLGYDAQATAIVQAVMKVAKALHLTVTAEGVEIEEQLVQLRGLKCERAQGFYFSRPQPGSNVTGL